MKILITGAAGFLGSTTVDLARAQGHNVRVLVRPTSDISALKLTDDQVFRGDLTDADSMRVPAEGIDAVIHCAATTSQGRPDLEKSRRTNVQGTRDLISAVQAGHDNAESVRWIQISSMSSHSGSTSVYGMTKFECDGVVMESGLAWTLLRPSIIYGPGGRGVTTKTLDVMRKLPVVPVVGSGRDLLRPVLARDVAAAALGCLAEPKTVGKTYMIGGPDEISFNEFLSRLGEAGGVNRPTIHLPIWLCMIIARTLGLISSEPPLTTDNVLGVKQAQRVQIQDAINDFGFAPTCFEEGLRETFA